MISCLLRTTMSPALLTALLLLQGAQAAAEPAQRREPRSPATASTREALRQLQLLRKIPVVQSSPLEVPNTMNSGKRLAVMALVDASGRPSFFQGIFKPPLTREGASAETRQMMEQRGIPYGSDHRREAGYSLTAAYMGCLSLPSTLRRLDGQLGSLQVFAGDAESAFTRFTPHDWQPAKAKDVDLRSLLAMLVVDYVTNQRDRHFNNILVARANNQDHLIPIDNGIGFAPATDQLPAFSALYRILFSKVTGQAFSRSRESWLALMRSKTLPQLEAQDWQRIKDTDERQLARHLRRIGLEPRVVADSIARLRLVKREGLNALVTHPLPGIFE